MAVDERPLWVKNGSPAWTTECPVLSVEQKSILGGWTSEASQELPFSFATALAAAAVGVLSIVGFRG